MIRRQQTQQEQTQSSTNRSSLTRQRAMVIGQLEFMLENHRSMHEKLRFELKDHPSRNRILRQSLSASDHTKELFRAMCLLDTELDPGDGQEETIGNSDE